MPMKYWAVMKFFAREGTDRFGVASLGQSSVEVLDVVRVRLGVVGRRLYQLFNQGAHRNLSGLCNAFRAPISLIINF